MRRFEIRGATQGYRPQPGDLPDVDAYDAYPAQGSGFMPGDWRLYVMPDAVDAMCEHVDWGRDTARNRVEQGGLLFGQVHTHADVTFGVVQAAIAGRTSHADSVSMRLDAESWRDMYNRAAREAPAGSALIGWYHTHPGDLTAFFSSTDRDTQATHFAADWMFAAVLQPQRREWAVWHGADAEPCAGYLLEAKRGQVRADAARAGVQGGAAPSSSASSATMASVDIRIEFATAAGALSPQEWLFVGETVQALRCAPGEEPPKLLVSKREGEPMRFHAYDRQRALIAYLVERNVAVQADVQGGD